ncbi:type VI secretion system protein ImpL [Mesorhizobium sp. USDA 4775]|uniref:type VI secretion system membrane subunit TssM n=1 Tax=Mesorhizobium jarvisii TaxID=1777867 RepID=UPI0013182776|nr:type VI secretion system membrane subunit TssM [Mesorhizobium jarvisii]MCH4561146.1 type VI secretion system membrane subunit TssM [Mesorhizobium jarvisii]QGU21026.1 type VI secretion system membrane subunit TssM [Mesorhizobium huakuii 7653R]
MQSFKRALDGRWLGVIAVAIATAMIFIFGRHLSIGGFIPLDSLGEQLAASALMPIAYVVIYMIQGNVQDFFLGRVSGMLEGIGTKQKEADGGGSTSSDWDGARASAAAEAKAMSARFRQTRITLKRLPRHSVLGKPRLDQLPWYAIIGSPGSGKSAALANSGLSFPLEEKLSRKSGGVVEATRNCDWWFTDHAVLIDTPGYYMVQKRNPEQDRAVWQGFLRQLSRRGRHQPLSGVLVSIAINELSSSSEEELLDHARCIRQRILELYEELGLRLPIYILLTKSDLIAGFSEFFDDLGREGREAVWGFTFAQQPSESEGDPMDSYAAEYDTLVGRLNDRLLERLQQESNIHRRALVFSFPQQVASLKHLSHQFLQEAFARNAYEVPILLRGIYFVSAMQVGAPFDRIAGARSPTFGISLPATPISSDQKRSYFITRLLRQVVFANAGLVEAHPRVERRQRWIQYGLCTTIAAAMASAAAFLIVSYSRNVHLMEGARLAASSYAEEAGKLRLDRVDSSDLRPVLPLLERLRTVKTDYDEAARAENNFSGLVSAQSENLRIQAHEAYRRGLETILLPRLAFRLEALLAEHQDDPPFLYPALKIYLMLGGRGPFQPQDINEWMTLDWEGMYPAEADATLRRALADHLDALLDNPPLTIDLNSELIEKSRAKLQRLSMPRRVLNIVTNSTQAANLPTWRLSDHAGSMGGDVLMRKSGQPLNTGIAGIYTLAGFHGTFLRLLPQVAHAVAAEGWVLGDQATTSTGEAEETLRRAAMDLYFQEFAVGWDELINDISLRPMASVDDALRTLNALSAPTSPVRLFLAAAAQETKLGEPPERDTPTEGKGSAQKEPSESDLQSIFRSPTVADTPESHGQLYTDVHFLWLHQLVDVPPNSPPGAQAPIDSALSDLAALYQSIGEMQGLAGSHSSVKGDETAIAIRKIEAGAANLPPPIRQWILSVGRLSSKLSMSEAKRHVASLWAEGAGDLCRRVTAGRYPFSRKSRRDAPLEDFARLFSRDGLIDTFSAQYLAPFVDRSSGPREVQSTGSVDLQIDRESLAQFKRAAAIRDSMFKDAGRQPSIEFLLTVADTDRSTDEVVVEIDGQQITQRRGAYKPVRFRWPTVGGLGGASVTFNGFAPAALSKVGPWALFRLLDEGKAIPQVATDEVYVRIAAGRHWATFILQADTLNNPLSGNMLSRFRCPQI